MKMKHHSLTIWELNSALYANFSSVLSILNSANIGLSLEHYIFLFLFYIFYIFLYFASFSQVPSINGHKPWRKVWAYSSVNVDEISLIINFIIFVGICWNSVGPNSFWRLRYMVWFLNSISSVGLEKWSSILRRGRKSCAVWFKLLDLSMCYK